MKVISYSLFIFFALFQAIEKERPDDYIMIEFGGVAIDKAVPTVVFSMEYFDRMEIGFGPAFIINKCEYLSVSDVIRENKNTQKLDTADAAYYKFWIIRNNKKDLFGTSTTDATKDVFDEVVKQIRNKGKRTR
jgi:hypothetical protein